MNPDYSLGGKVLNVNLSGRGIETENTRDLQETFLGGLGIGLAKLLRTIPPEASPLDPENAISYCAGTLVGTMAPAACRLAIAFKNVFTGGLGLANSGGFFTPEMKYAGYDNITVTGRSDKPVYLYIRDDEISLEDASFIKGKSTWDTEEAIKQRHGDKNLQLLSIGPAGENLVSAANVMVSRSRSASRCGPGAVMGSKNLKAIAVRGTNGLHVAKPDEFMAACYQATNKILKSELMDKLKEYGTPVSYLTWNAMSALPTHNFQTTQLDPKLAERIGAPALKEKNIGKSFSCFSCPIQCAKFLEIPDQREANADGEKLECQLLWDFGNKLGLSDPAGIIKAAASTHKLGLDADNTSGAIAWAIECFERGILTTADTDGAKLRFGDVDLVLSLLHKIAYREGFGDLLAKGSVAAARQIGRGSERYAIHIKGQDLAEELRAFKGWALGVTVSARGGSHTVGAPLSERMDIDEELSNHLFGVPTASQPHTYEGKAGLVTFFERFHSVMEALGGCFFNSLWMNAHMLNPGDYTELYNLATGRDLSTDQLMNYGERLHNLYKLFNIHHGGFGRADDYPPDRMFDEPTTGTVAGLTLDREKWSQMLDEYYDYHAWDRETGRPTRETLQKLGLMEFAHILE